MECWLPENVELNSKIIIPAPTCVITKSKVALALLCFMENHNPVVLGTNAAPNIPEGRSRGLKMWYSLEAYNPKEQKSLWVLTALQKQYLF